MMARKFFKNSSEGKIAIFIVLGVIFFGALTMTGGLFPREKQPYTPGSGDIVNIPPNTAIIKENALQMIAIGPRAVLPPTATPRPGNNPLPTATRVPPPGGGIRIPTPTSTPRPTATPDPRCTPDHPFPITTNCVCEHFVMECQGGACLRLISFGGNPLPPNNCNVPNIWDYDKAWFDRACANPSGTWPTSRPGPWPDANYCIAKPVVYLYPESKTSVDVYVETSGEIVVSDPLYPSGGWKNVIAYPDGNLIYQGKSYRELFYETSVNEIEKPDNGIIVEAENIDKTLKQLNSRLGLSDFESKELRDFWTERLKALGSKYILVSLITNQGKDDIDKLVVNPKPDTLIEVLYYFKALDKPTDIKSLELPETPMRVGFTAVEWGGTIDHGR